MKRFFVFLIAYFLLMLSSTVHADIILPGQRETTIPLLIIILVGALVAGTVTLIRRFWKPQALQPADTGIHKSRAFRSPLIIILLIVLAVVFEVELPIVISVTLLIVSTAIWMWVFSKPKKDSRMARKNEHALDEEVRS